MTTMKSAMAVERVEVRGTKVMETIDKPKPQPAAIVPVWAIPAVIGPVGSVLVSIGRLGSGRIAARVARTGRRRTTRESEHRKDGGAKRKPAHAPDMVSPGDGRKSDGSVASKRDCLHDGWWGGGRVDPNNSRGHYEERYACGRLCGSIKTTPRRTVAALSCRTATVA
jgi:hypothetical protein